jgi:hypothetical protein
VKKTKLTFTKHTNSFSVHVENLEELSVEQIKALEEFVSARKGVFDFDSYTFVIQKKLDFREFLLLLVYCNIDATCREYIPLEKQNIKVSFGKYKGMLYSELPDSYLLWLKSSYRGKERDIIDAEIAARKL